MRLVVFLGNPGNQYRHTRHNAAWLFFEHLQQTGRAPQVAPKASFFGEVGRAENSLLFLLPQTFMNESGKSVGAAARFFQVEAHNILLVHDEIDMQLGQVRFRNGGRSGGHRGVADVHRALSTEDIPRLKIGIHSPLRAEHRIDAADFVLRNFTAEEANVLEASFPLAAEKLLAWVAKTHA